MHHRPDHDLLLAYAEQRPALLRLLAYRRAKLEWVELREKGDEPAVMVEHGTEVGHWLITEGLTAFVELAACGHDIHVAIDKTGQRVRADRISCTRCLRLLERVSGALPQPSAVVTTTPTTEER